MKKMNFKIAALCLAAFASLGVVSCSGRTDISSAVSSTSTHTHSASTTWSYDKKQHYHTCTTCGEKMDEASHTYEKTTIPANGDAKAKIKYTCSVCGYSYEEDKTSYSVTFQKDSDHPDTVFKLYNSIIAMEEVADGSEIKVGSTYAVEIDDGTDDNSTIMSVKANGVAMKAQSNFLYTATMPEEEVVITVTYGDKTPAKKVYTLTYNDDTAHPGTYVSFGTSVEDIMNGKIITTASAGDTVCIMTSYDPDKDTLAGVYVNGTLAAKSADYGWMLSSFTMPSEDVVVTVTYEGDTSGSTTYTLTYNDDANHPNTYVSFGTSAENMMNGYFITAASAGDTVCIMTSNDTETLAGVYVNGTLAAKSADYGWMLSSFTMPSEDVVVTVTYAE